VLHSILHALLHYTGGDNGSGPWYLELSGSVGDIPLFAAAIVLIRKHNCHVKGCTSIITHTDPEVHAPACKRHHSLRHKRGVPQ